MCGCKWQNRNRQTDACVCMCVCACCTYMYHIVRQRDQKLKLTHLVDWPTIAAGIVVFLLIFPLAPTFGYLCTHTLTHRHTHKCIHLQYACILINTNIQTTFMGKLKVQKNLYIIKSKRTCTRCTQMYISTHNVCT